MNRIEHWGFAATYYHIKSMMEHTRLHKNLNTGMWPGCVAATTNLQNTMVKPY